MEPGQGEGVEDIVLYHHVHIIPVQRDGRLYAELRLVSTPPCPAKVLSIGELETLIDDAQHVLTQLRWGYATYYVVTETASIEHDTRHLVPRATVEQATDIIHTLCGREIVPPYGRWSFSPLVYAVETAYHLCRTCAHLHRLRERKAPTAGH